MGGRGQREGIRQGLVRKGGGYVAGTGKRGKRGCSAEISKEGDQGLGQGFGRERGRV